MNAPRFARLYLVCLIALVAVAHVAPAAAATITPAPADARCTTGGNRTICHWANGFTVSDPEVYTSCDGFDALVTFTVERRYTTFYDAEGNGLREIRHVYFTGTVSNSTDASKAVPYVGRFTRTVDVEANTVTITGLFRQTLIPGEGVLLLDAGRTVLDADDFSIITQSGPSEFDQKICSALE